MSFSSDLNLSVDTLRDLCSRERPNINKRIDSKNSKFPQKWRKFVWYREGELNSR